MRAHLRADGLRLRTGAAESMLTRYRKVDVPAALQEVFAPLVELLEALDAADSTRRSVGRSSRRRAIP